MTNIDSNTSKPVVVKNKRIVWSAILGWTIAIIFLILFLRGKYANEGGENTFKDSRTEKISIQNDLQEARKQLQIQNGMLDILQSKNFQTYTLMGNQAVAPQAYSKIYLNKKEGLAYVDAKGLPPPPQGKVFQLWSLNQDSFLPTVIGLIDESSKDKNGLYRFENFPEPETLCITLENKGGSKAPTMSQIYVMDMIK